MEGGCGREYKEGLKKGELDVEYGDTVRLRKVTKSNVRKVWVRLLDGSHRMFYKTLSLFSGLLQRLCLSGFGVWR